MSVTQSSYDVNYDVNIEAVGHLLKVSLKEKTGVHNELIKARIASGKQSKRGKVLTFSRYSRKRMLEMMNRIEAVDKPVFLTLTYPQDFPTPQESKKQLWSLLKRINRRFPSASFVWRLEFQKRGAPHFHLIAYNLPYVRFETLRRMWGQIIGFSDPRVKIEMLQSQRQAQYYVSKYIAKVEAPSASESSEADSAEGGFLVNESYLSAEVEGVDDKSGIGRLWGLWNRDCIPWAKAIEFKQELGRWFWMMKRGARKYYKGVNGQRYKGFTLYVGNVFRWLEYWGACNQAAPA